MRFTLSLTLAVLLMNGMNGYAQQQPQQLQQQGPELSNELRLERENMLLTARVAELEAQLTQLKTVLVNDRIAKAAPTLIQKLQAAAPEWDVNPNTLEFTRKQTAVAPTTTPQVAPTVTPQVASQPRP
jgi:hypothetical protein